MLTLLEKISTDLKQAMREKSELELSVLRMLLSALKNKKIGLGNKDELDNEQSIAVARSEIKKRKDSIIAYEQGERQDLADKEKEEIKILEKYMPAQMSEEEIKAVVKDVVDSMDEASIQDFGRIMGQVMARTKGQADGNKVSEIVKKALAS